MPNKLQQTQNKRTGFTYIELIVVIGIVGILSILAVISFQASQKNGRDRQRMSDIATIMSAMETFKSRYGNYPCELYGVDCNGTSQLCDSSIGLIGNCNIYQSAGGYYSTNWEPIAHSNDLVSKGILKALPKDPINTFPYFYRFEQDSTQAGQGSPACAVDSCRYILITLLENGEKNTGGRGKCFYQVQGGYGTMAGSNYRWMIVGESTYNPYCK